MVFFYTLVINTISIRYKGFFFASGRILPPKGENFTPPKGVLMGEIYPLKVVSRKNICHSPI